MIILGIVTKFCLRPYGLRISKHRATKVTPFEFGPWAELEVISQPGRGRGRSIDLGLTNIIVQKQCTVDSLFIHCQKSLLKIKAQT